MIAKIGSVLAHRNWDLRFGNSLSARRSRRGPEFADGAGIRDRRWVLNGVAAFFDGIAALRPDPETETRRALEKFLERIICIRYLFRNGSFASRSVRRMG